MKTNFFNHLVYAVYSSSLMRLDTKFELNQYFCDLFYL